MKNWEKDTLNLNTVLAKVLDMFFIVTFSAFLECTTDLDPVQCRFFFFCPLCLQGVLLCCLMCVRSSVGTPELWSEMLIRRDDSLWLRKQTLTIVAFQCRSSHCQAATHYAHCIFFRLPKCRHCKELIETKTLLWMGGKILKKKPLVNVLKEETNLLAAKNIFCQVETGR